MTPDREAALVDAVALIIAECGNGYERVEARRAIAIIEKSARERMIGEMLNGIDPEAVSYAHTMTRKDWWQAAIRAFAASHNIKIEHDNG